MAELTEEKLLGLRKLVSVCYRNNPILHNEPFEDVYQTAILHVVETHSDLFLSTWLVYHYLHPKEYYDYNYPALFSNFKSEDDTKNPEVFLGSSFNPYDEDTEGDHKVIYDLSEKLYEKREDLREGFTHYCFGEDSDLLNISRRNNIRLKVFRYRFVILEKLFNSGFLSLEVYTKYLKLANELQELPKLPKVLNMSSECICNRKSMAKNRDKVLARKREYYKRKQQARLNSAKEQLQ